MRFLKVMVVTSLLLVMYPTQARSEDAKVTDRYLNGKIALIPIQFSDIDPVLSTEKIYDSFKSLDNPVSIASYANIASYGKFKLDFGAFNPTKWLKLKKTKYQYEVREGTIIYEPQTTKFVNDSINLAKENGLDIDEYDNDKNGEIDCYIIVVAGSSHEEVKWNSAKIYTEMYDIYDSDYTEWISNIIPSYVINADLQHLASFNYVEPIGIWDITGTYGERKVAGLNSFNRWKLGLLDFREISEPGTYEIDDLNGDGPNKSYKIKMPGTENEWILLENRQKSGLDAMFDKVPNPGIVMYHFDSARPYDDNFNRYSDYIGNGSFGLKVFFNKHVDKLHETAAWSADVGKTEMSWRNSTDNEPLFIKNYTGRHILIKNISKSGQKMTFELAYEDNSPDRVTDVEMLDFGNVRKGIKKTLKVLFYNNESYKTECTFFTNVSWITFKPEKLKLGKADLSVTIDTSELKFGRNIGKIQYRTDIMEKKLDVVVNVTNPIGDVNSDFKVTNEDAELFMNHFGAKTGDSNYNPVADFNEDGVIDVNDFFMISRYFKSN